MQRKIRKPKRQSPKLLKEFIFKMHPLEQAAWKKVAGPAGAKTTAGSKLVMLNCANTAGP